MAVFPPSSHTVRLCYSRYLIAEVYVEARAGDASLLRCYTMYSSTFFCMAELWSSVDEAWQLQ